jgi:hypothetical protein
LQGHEFAKQAITQLRERKDNQALLIEGLLIELLGKPVTHAGFLSGLDSTA